MHIKNLKVFFYFIFLLLIFTLSIVIFVKNIDNYGFNYLFLLPLVFLIISVLIFELYIFLFKYFTFTLVYFLYFIRMVIHPLLIHLTNNKVALTLGRNIISDHIIKSNLTNAVILICYEFIIIFIIIYLYYKFINIKPQNIQIKIFTISKMFKQLINIMFIFFIIAICFYPHFLNYFEFFITDQNKTNYEYSKGLIFMKSTIPYFIYWPVLFIINILQIFLPILLILFINNYKNINNRLIKYILSLFVVLLTFIIMTPQKITSIQLSLVLFVILNLLYPYYSKKISFLIILNILFFSFLALSIKVGFTSKSLLNSLFQLSAITNVYFGGVFNVSASLAINNEISYKIILSDILRNIPFINYFFKNIPNTVNIFNNLILGEKQTYLIIPMIGQGKFYFGYIFAPFFSIISILLALYYENKFKNSYTIIGKYLYLYISFIFGLSPIMYNFNILVSFLFNAFFCLILLFISKTLFIYKKTNSIVKI